MMGTEYKLGIQWPTKRFFCLNRAFALESDKGINQILTQINYGWLYKGKGYDALRGYKIIREYYTE